MSDGCSTEEVLQDTESSQPGKSKEKDRKKQLRILQEEFEVLTLSPWERYRALTDLADQQTDMVEMADRKTRFALVILAALNTVNLIAVARPQLLTGAVVEQGLGMAIYVTFYALLSLYLCVEAIGALKPRLTKALIQTADVSKAQKWLDLLSLDAIHKMPADDYYELWRTAQHGQLNREIAFKNQTVARIILLKYAAVERLFRGLTVLVLLTAVLILYLLNARLSLVL